MNIIPMYQFLGDNKAGNEIKPITDPQAKGCTLQIKAATTEHLTGLRFHFCVQNLAVIQADKYRFAPDIFSFDNVSGANGRKKVHLTPRKGGGGVIDNG